MSNSLLVLKKPTSRQYPPETITGADYADDLVLLANTPTQAKSLLHCLEQATRGTGLSVNSNKTKFMCFNQDGAITLLNGKPLK